MERIKDHLVLFFASNFLICSKTKWIFSLRLYFSNTASLIISVRMEFACTNLHAYNWKFTPGSSKEANYNSPNFSSPELILLVFSNWGYQYMPDWHLMYSAYMILGIIIAQQTDFGVLYRYASKRDMTEWKRIWIFFIMPEAIIIILDNSDYSINGDYEPTRWLSQIDAAGLLIQAKL